MFDYFCWETLMKFSMTAPKHAANIHIEVKSKVNLPVPFPNTRPSTENTNGETNTPKFIELAKIAFASAMHDF